MGKIDTEVRLAVEQTVPAEYIDQFVEVWGSLNEQTSAILVELAPLIATDHVQLSYLVDAIKAAQRGHQFGSQAPRALLIAVSRVKTRLKHLEHSEIYEGMLKHFTDQTLAPRRRSKRES